VRRVFVVDDSAAVRSLLGDRLRAEGYHVEVFPDAERAVEGLAAGLPDAVVTDLVMPGLSGVQLCRLLRSDAATTHIPVLLLTASGDKRSRFWARSAGAAAYVGKDRLDEVLSVLPTLVAPALPAAPAPRLGRTLLERISGVLDDALFESVLAGEVRSLASSGSLPRLFEGLCRVVSEVLDYRSLALMSAARYAPLYLHASPRDVAACEAAVREQLRVPAERPTAVVADDRAIPGEGGPARVLDVTFGSSQIARLVVAPTTRLLSRADERILAVLASELSGPLQMTALHEDARQLASTDSLTGLLNRRAFLDALERERARADRHDYPLSLLLLDVDHFKRVNDQHGHAAGDVVLRGVAEALLQVARRSDYVGRWGGEEFVLALPQTGPAGALVAAERVRRAVQKARHALPEGGEIRVTASLGVVSAEAPWNVATLVGAADDAMYLAKGRGRDRVEAVSLATGSAA
jgi:two-component system cell cycle response regulator